MDGPAQFSLQLSLQLKPSRIEACMLWALHALALTAPWLSALPIYVSAALSLLIAGSGYQYWKTPVIDEQLLLRDGRWQRVRGIGAPEEVALQEYLLRWYLMILVFKNEAGRKSRVLIWPDRLSNDDFRQLRVYLQLRGALRPS